MNAIEAAALIGRTASYAVGAQIIGEGEPLRFAVTIKDVRLVYGRVDYLVRPVAGEGETWVSEARIFLDAKA